MLIFSELSTEKRYTLPHIKGHGYSLKLVSKDETEKGDGYGNGYKSAQFKATGGNKRTMDVVKDHVFNVTFWEDGDQYTSDTVLTVE